MNTRVTGRWMAAPQWAWDKLEGRLSHPRLALHLALIALLLSSPALGLGFYLDDYIGRYIYSDLEGAARLYRNYSGGYGLAIGDPVENHWQMEAGWAPWWHYERLRLSMFRPLGVALHRLDFWLWPDSPRVMHAHNLLWLVALVLAVTAMYRSILGVAVGGAAALLFALDHTHGFVVGHICNRHGLVGALLGALCLAAHFRYRLGAGLTYGMLAPLCYLLGLLTSESTVAIAGYVLAYEGLASRGAWSQRAIAAAPYVAITLVWRALYNAAGFGASGSGLYLDLGREPLRYLQAFLERGPIYLLGQLSMPPAEAYLVLPAPFDHLMLGWALAVLALAVWALAPLLKRDAHARFWGLGMLGALVPAATTDPHNRQLMFASFGAMGLLAQLWRFHASELGAFAVKSLRWAKGLAVLFLGFRLLASPLMLPFATVVIALTAPMHHAAAAVGDEAAGRDLIFVTAPQAYTVRLVQLIKRIHGDPLPRRIRTLSCGPQQVIVTRSGPRTLDVVFQGGLLSEPPLELHRDRRLPMPAGTIIQLSGFQVEVLHTTPDGRPDRARFTFDRALEDPALVFMRWDARRFVPFTPPAPGQRVTLPGARSPLGLE